MKNHAKKCAPKASPSPLFNFLKITQTSHYMQEILLKMRHCERGLSKSL